MRDIKSLLEQQYRIEVSPDFISSVTDAVQAEVVEWQNRPLQRMYPLVFFDALDLSVWISMQGQFQHNVTVIKNLARALKPQLFVKRRRDGVARLMHRTNPRRP